jgi:type II secretory pathway pseudopilin PulG
MQDGEFMDSGKPQTPLDLGIYGRPVRRKVEFSDIVAAVLSLIWVAIVAGFWFFIGISSDGNTPGFNPLTFVMTMVSILLPVGLIWVASAGAKTARVMREESGRLQASIDAMRHAYVSQQQQAGQVVKPSLEKQLGDIRAAQKQTQTPLRRSPRGATRGTKSHQAPRPLWAKSPRSRRMIKFGWNWGQMTLARRIRFRLPNLSAR